MKSNICTDINQGARLLACGVDPMTADMVWLNRGELEPFLSFNEGCNRAIPEVGDVPAWSLSKLITLLPMEIETATNDYVLRFEASPYAQECEKWQGYYHDEDYEMSDYRQEGSTPIEACVRMIEWLTEQGYSLNKTEE